MKKLFLLLLIFPLLFVACSSDDDDEMIDKALVGTWSFDPAMAKAEIVNDLEGNKLAAYIEDEMVENFTLISMSLEDSGDATVTFADGSRERAEWAANQGKFAIRFLDSDGSYTTFNYTLKGEKDLVLKLDRTKEKKEALAKGEYNSLLGKDESFEKTSITKAEIILEAKKK